MSTLLSALKARNTKVFVINNYKNTVEETTLFEHVAESAEETTSPRGVMHKMFVSEKTGDIYQKTGDVKLITETEYENLFDEDREDYEYYGEGTIAYELCQWMATGKIHIIDTYTTEEEANDAWYTRTYNCDFMPDDQRDTMYFNTREEAEAEFNVRLANQ